MILRPRDEIELKRSVGLLIDLSGADASVYAAIKADAMLAAADLEQYHLWMQIGRVVEEMQVIEEGIRQ